MTEQEYELLSQYLDGELGQDQTQALLRRLSAEPQLQAGLERMRTVNESVRQALRGPGTDTVPPRVAAMLQPAESNIVPFPQRRSSGWRYAIAASFVAACSLLLIQDWQSPSAGDALLSAALEQAPSRGDGWESLQDGRRVRPVLSFAHRDGSWCREYIVSTGDGENMRGVACRMESRWVTQVLTQSEQPGSSADYRPAGAAQADEVASFIESNSADIALSASREAALIARGWQP